MPPPSGQPDPVLIWAMGDSGRGNSAQRSVRDAMLTAIGGEELDLMLHVGDLAYNLCTDGEISNGTGRSDP